MRPPIRGDVPAAAVLWSSAGSRPSATLVCKLTFDLAPGKLQRSPGQEPIVEADRFWDESPARSLRFASDLSPRKPKLDVYVVGHAYAPGGRSTRSVVARLVVGTLDKSIEVLADRSAGPDGTILHGPKFSQMPLVYERAIGGPRTWNPIGIRPDVRDAYGRSALPNLLPVSARPDVTPEPAGFGPIAPRWPGRLEKLGRFAPTFPHEAWTREPLPAGFDFAYFNAAPADQQLAALRGGETILLENLHRTESILSTKVPTVRPRASAKRASGVEPVAMVLDTLVIDTDRSLLVMTWRGSSALEHASDIPAFDVEMETFAAHDLEITQGLRDQPDDSLFVTHETGEPPAVPTARSARHEALPFAPAAAAKPEERPATAPPPPSPVADIPWAGARPAPLPHLVDPPTPAPPAPPLPAPPLPAPHAAAPPAAAPAWTPPLSPPGLVTHAANAALLGAAGASNAASDPRQASALATAGGGPVRARPAEVLELVWFDPAVTARVKRNPEWKRILDELEETEFDPEAEVQVSGDAPEDADDKRELFEVLTRATPSGPEKIDEALALAIRKDGYFAPRLLLVSGDLAFEFEELELLKATVAAATPFAGAEDDLGKAVERAATFLQAPGLVVAPDVARGFTQRIRDAFAASPRLVQASYLEEQTERALLERRAYQQRSAFGRRHLRGELVFLGMDGGVPTYLPEDLAKKLPMFRRFRARLLTEVHYQEDQHEAHAASFKAVALARVVR
ncbi:MAG: DUF2169 domain-containing protein [Myxococcales bacterium]|nr:DUF2169 domain-containing protein [Myxococcales bacterium]